MMAAERTTSESCHAKPLRQSAQPEQFGQSHLVLHASAAVLQTWAQLVPRCSLLLLGLSRASNAAP